MIAVAYHFHCEHNNRAVVVIFHKPKTFCSGIEGMMCKCRMPEPDGATPGPAQASEQAQQVMRDGLQTLKSAMESGVDVSCLLLAIHWPLRRLHVTFDSVLALCQHGRISLAQSMQNCFS